MKRLVIIAILSAITSTLMAQNLFAKGSYNPYDKLRRAALAISALYVDTVDDNKLAEDAIRGMIENLDPHSSYSTAKQARAFNESLGGSFDGIGVQFNISADTLLVIKPVVKGPSEKVGIMAGDRIISVNDTAIAGVKMDQSEIMRRLRGKRGTMVHLGVVRRGIKEVLYFDVKRDKIPLNTIDAAYMIRPQVGYIRIGSFGAYTYKEFMDAVKKLNKEGMKNLILDLQENGGGYMLSATQIVNEFLGKNDLIVYTEGRNDKRREYHRGTSHLWQGSRPAPHRVPRRFDDASYHRPLLHPVGPLHPEALHDGQRGRLQQGYRHPLQARRVLQCRQHPLC